jgi:hypothetical protein
MAGPDGHGQGIDHERCPHVIGIEKPTTRRLARSMQVARYSQPSWVAAVRDVADVGAVEGDALRMEGPTQAVDHGRVRLRIGDGGPDLAPAMTSGQTPQRHETGHSFSTHAISFAGQDGSDPRCAVCGATLGVDLDDLGPELRVLERTWARLW